ncbi:hypothetical protein DPMN_191840 [Dreissena polymorpha]|uniref:Uncharacterized protein n=1 Tax=Dreissena polymorpha TaxID=45954 RepID=A0A9D4BCB8_DREPO|nr:hypothetical protein DPMN_191840 [Dreissena polymorpha]
MGNNQTGGRTRTDGQTKGQTYIHRDRQMTDRQTKRQTNILNYPSVLLPISTSTMNCDHSICSRPQHFQNDGYNAFFSAEVTILFEAENMARQRPKRIPRRIDVLLKGNLGWARLVLVGPWIG